MVNHYMGRCLSLDFLIGRYSVLEHPILNLRLLEIGILALLVIGKCFLALLSERPSIRATSETVRASFD